MGAREDGLQQARDSTAKGRVEEETVPVKRSNKGTKQIKNKNNSRRTGGVQETPGLLLRGCASALSPARGSQCASPARSFAGADPVKARAHGCTNADQSG